MVQPETFRGDIGVYGLGPHLFSQNHTDSKIIGHDGNSNRPAINTAARIDLMSKNGIIILEMGHPNLASTMADEWMFWKAGIADFVVMQRNMSRVIIFEVVGSIIIILAFLLYFRTKSKKSKIENI